MNNFGTESANSCQLKAKSRPRLVRSGKVASGRPFTQILQLITSADNSVELGILHIRGSMVQGDIVIASGTFILGASTNSGSTGWAAVRQLLQLTDAVYQFHDFSQSDIGSLDQGMEVKLSRVIALLPDLPPTLEELSAKVSLTRMRSMNIDEIISDRLAEQATTKYLAREVKNFEEKSMRFRAVILWSFCALMTLAALAIHQMTP